MPIQGRSGGDEGECVWEINDEAVLLVRVWNGVEGAGAAWVKYPGTACPWLLRVCGQGGVEAGP
jgi:hypothetical protein